MALTDGSDYTISDSGIVHNKFSEKKSVSGLDFGGIAVINIKKVNINLAFYKIFYFRWDCARILILNVLS